MSHEHFHCFVDMLLARPVHLDETSGAIDGSVAEVRRLQDVNADMLAALKEARKAIWHEVTEPYASALLRRIDAAIAKAEGRS